MKQEEFLKWLRSIELKWQKLWKEHRVFEAEPSDKPKFFITVPYPYTNGPLHIGHGRTYTIGDIIARYMRMKGFNVLYPMAFHITGTPIIAISEKISRGDPIELSRYREYISMYTKGDHETVSNILKSFTNPLNLAVFFAERIAADFEALGYSIDWRRKFHTGEPIYNAFVTWHFLKLNEKELIKRGEHVVTFCLLHQQPEGEDDIEDADINPVDIIEYVSIKFRLKDSDEYLLASTLRPETLFGATNIWVNPDATYVTISWRNERLILSREALVKFKYQHPNDNVTVINEIRGYELVGRKAYSPLGTELLILPAEFVDPGNATGIVYSEPSDAPYDYVALMDIKNNPVKLEKYGISIDEVKAIEPIKIIDVPGVNGHHAEIIVKQMGIIDQRDPRLEDATRIVYKEQFYKGRMIVEDPVFKGLSVQEAKERMRNRLYSMNQAIPFYEVSRKAKCRSGGEIIVAKISDQWFIDYSLDWLKNSGKKFVEEKLIVIPDKYKKSILNTIDWLDKRPCARKRGLGTKLPFDKDWIIESLSDSTIYMAFYTIVHHIRNAGLKPEQLKPSLFDYVFLGLGDPVKVSEETGINVDLVEKMRREFLYWYPVDLRHTGVAHLSNHLTFYILNHIAIFGEEHWPRMITLNELVIREGDKMSKSKGNVILLREIAEKYSADVFRLYVASAANLDTVLDWREKDVLSVLDSLKKFIDIASESIKANCRKPMNRLIDKWFFSRFNKLLREASESLDKMEIRDYIQKIFFQFLKLFDKYREATCDEDSYCITRTVLDKLLKALNPVIPHVTEEIWEWIGGEKFLSLQNWPTPDDFLINDELEILFDNLDRIVDDLKNVLAVYKPVKNTAYIIVASPWKREAISLYVKWRDTRKVIEEIRDKYGLKGREQEIVSVVNQFIKEYDENIIKTSTDLEYAVYSEAKNYIEKKTSLNIRVVWEEEARSLNIPRANRAYPLKPAFYIE